MEKLSENLDQIHKHEHKDWNEPCSFFLAISSLQSLDFLNKNHKLLAQIVP